MTRLDTFGIACIALVVFGFGVAAACWEWLRRHPDHAAVLT